MQFNKLIEEIEEKVDDSTYDSSDTVKSLINDAVRDIAAGVLVPGENRFTDPLPDLYTVESSFSLTNSSRSASLPNDFQRDLVKAYEDDGLGDIPILISWRRFLDKWPALETGSYVEGVVVRGSSLYYHPAVTTTLEIGYYANPSTLSSDTDDPSCVPAHLQRGLIINHVCRELYSRIEDGMEGRKVNTEYYDQMFQEAVLMLDLWIGEDGDPEYIEDIEDYIE